MDSIADERKGSGRKKILKGFCGNFSYSTTVQRRLVSAKNKRILPTPTMAAPPQEKGKKDTFLYALQKEGAKGLWIRLPTNEREADGRRF